MNDAPQEGENPRLPAILYLVPTPIGNLEDITLRALRILNSVDRILAEDTRHTARLLGHHGIATPMSPFHEHNAQSRIGPALADLAAGRSLALVSDAGSPGISDPGAPLVRAVVDAGYRVEALPGATALIPALTASGLDARRFAFEGFPPRKSGQLRAFFADLAQEPRTLILYESPRRLADTLNIAAQELGADRPACVARELTKLYETLHRGTLGELAEQFTAEAPRGEIVLVIAGADVEAARQALDPEQVVRELLESGLSVKEAAKEAAKQTGRRKSEMYDVAVKLKG
ncbi:16S rRNA (cytidine(1402)-2'-O)-methyltransferase [Magnetofaba australis]|nr:16S rRNA (cytidine(1402)-2'-O)-methyltransferase [Magnetofaba australis]